MPRNSLDRDGDPQRHFTREEVYTALSNIFRRYPFSKPRAEVARSTLEGIKIEFADQSLKSQTALLEWFARLDEWSDPMEVGRPHQTPKIPSPWSEDTQASQQLKAIAEQVKDLIAVAPYPRQMEQEYQDWRREHPTEQSLAKAFHAELSPRQQAVYQTTQRRWSRGVWD